MILTPEYTWISGRRNAVLNEQIAQRLLDKYDLSSGESSLAPSVRRVLDLNQKIRDYSEGYIYQGKEDLLIEWLMSSVSRGSGRWGYEDIGRLLDAANFYFTCSKEQKFKNLVDRYNKDNHKSINPKNLIDFTLHDMEDIKEEYEHHVVDPRVNQIQSKLPDGATMFYNDGNYQIVEVTTPQAACDLGRGTKWCTSNEYVSPTYLSQSPLYVIYQNGKKYAQFHISDSGVYQLKDLKDRPLVLYSDEGLMHAIMNAGLSQRIGR